MNIDLNIEHLNKWAKLFSQKQKVLIVSHANADGDAIGSITGLYGFLSRMGHNVAVAVPNPFRQALAFLDRSHIIQIYTEHPEAIELSAKEATVIVYMDLSAHSRMDKLGEFLLGVSTNSKGEKIEKILLDHHLEPAMEEFDLVFSRTDVSSCCELTFHLLKAWKNDLQLTQSEAECLYGGMLTDTNQFSNSIFDYTFQAAYELNKFHIDHSYLIENLFRTFKEDRMRLMGYVLYHKMVVLPKYHAAYIVLTEEELNTFHYATGDNEGFANLPLSIVGINIAGLFTQHDKFIRISLRSMGDFSVNKMANIYFNGGGHFNAAGGKFFGTTTQVGKVFEQALIEMEADKYYK